MSKKPQTHRNNLPMLPSEMFFQMNKTKSALNILVNPPDKVPQRASIVETPQANSKSTTRNFKFSFGPSKEVKKNYVKNSDKTIKPPEKVLKAREVAVKSLKPTRQKASTFLRSGTIIKTSTANVAEAIAANRKRSLTFDNLDSKTQFGTTPSYARIDNKSVNELERRLENLQTIFMNKLELLKNREPNALKKEYKFVAMLIGDEAKLVVKENDARSLPNFIPARSLEDLNIKIGKFFTGCLLSFTDKLRAYQKDNRAINCDEIFKDLKREEQDFCTILKEWVLDLCDEADKTLTPESLIESDHIKHDQIKSVNELGIQTDFEFSMDGGNQSEPNFKEFVNLRIERSQLKQQMLEKNDEYLKGVEQLKKQHELKINELTKSLHIQEAVAAAKDEEINKLQETNETLSQQIREKEESVQLLTKQNEELNSKLKNENDLVFELKRAREEFQRMREENSGLVDMKANFLKRLHQRSTRIDLLEKESKQQKRKVESQNKELEDLKLEFEAKVKESREYKESLEARNNLIDHLRKAIEIEQRKRKEYEVMLSSKTNITLAANNIVIDEHPLEAISKLNASPPKHQETKSTPKRSERSKRNCDVGKNTLNMNEINTLKIYDKKSIAKGSKIGGKGNAIRRHIEGEENPFALNLPKDDTDASSADEKHARELHLSRKRKSRTINVKKYEV